MKRVNFDFLFEQNRKLNPQNHIRHLILITIVFLLQNWFIGTHIYKHLERFEPSTENNFDNLIEWVSSKQTSIKRSGEKFQGIKI